MLFDAVAFVDKQPFASLAWIQGRIDVRTDGPMLASWVMMVVCI